MLTYSAETEISASPETIWGILTDGAKFTEWDKQMISLSGKIAPGEKLTIYTKLAPNRPFNIMVTTFEPNKKMVWGSGMPMGLFKGERTFTLTPAGNGKTKFSTREEFSGLLLPLFGRMIPDLNPVFAEFVASVKKRAEGV